MENAEDVLMQLTNLEKTPPDSVPKALEDYLIYVAKTGNTVFPWPKIKPLFKLKLEKVISEFYQSCPIDDTPQLPNVDQFKFSAIKEKIFEQLDSFSGIPFTVQRLCELMTAPKKHYRRTDKFMRGLEKNMLVVSTVEASPLSGEQASLTMNGDGAGEGPSGHKHLNNGHSLGLHHDRVLHHDLAEHMSPSKRLRLSSPPPEEAGPCDSPDGQVTPPQEKSETDSSSSPEEAQSSSSVTPMDNVNVNDDEEAMDIDAECTSSQATIQEAAKEDVKQREAGGDLTARDGVESSDESVAPSANIKQRTDSESTAEALSDVDASDLDLDEPEKSEESLKVEDTVSTSAGKSESRMKEDRDGDDCSSSDDPVGEVVEGQVEEGVSQSNPVRDMSNNMEEMDSEAEPADSEGEKEAAVDVVEGGNASEEAVEGSKEDDEDDNVSVQSSDSLDGTARPDPSDGEKEGAADSSDQAVATASVDTAQESSEDSSEDAVEESNKVEEALVVTDQQEDGAADNPSQSSGD